MIPISAWGKFVSKCDVENGDYTGGKFTAVASGHRARVLDYFTIRKSWSDSSDVSTFSIPRWLPIATAAVLVFVIFVIVVHPYYDVSNATAVEKLLLAFVVTAVAVAVVGLVRTPAIARALQQPHPLPVVERNCTRRI